MAKWLQQASHFYKMYCHDLKVMGSNPSLVELRVRSTSVLNCTWTKTNKVRCILCYSKRELLYVKPMALGYSHVMQVFIEPKKKFSQMHEQAE